VQEGAATEAGTKIAFDRFGELMLVDAQLEYAETYQFVSEPERFCFVRMTVDIDKLTNGRRLELSFSVDNDAFEFSAATRPEDLADQLKLIATKLEYPGWHAASVERAKALASAEYDSYAMSAMTMVQRDVQQLVASGDPRWKTPAPGGYCQAHSAAIPKLLGADFGIGAGRGAGVRRF
jgi:hypothetical protein